MTILEYENGKLLEMKALELRRETGGNEFYSLIQAAMRQADSINAENLKAGYPDIWRDLQDRYNAPGGILPTDGTEVKE